MSQFKLLPSALSAGAALTLLAGQLLHASEFPVTIDNCGRTLTFEKPPSRAVSHDMNMSEIMFALELQDRMVGVTGITGWYTMTPDFAAAMGDIPELASKEPTMENLLGADLDFFFAGWYYGMNPGDAVTPDSLAEYDVPVYVLTESCIHVDKSRPPASMDMLYVDVLNIGEIFDRAEKARALVEQYKSRIAKVADAIEGASKIKVFLYDSGEEMPFTAGKYAMPTAMIEVAGGKNIMDDVETSWGRVGWESVIDRNPEFIIIVGFGDESWKDRWAFLKNTAALRDIEAVKNDRFLVLGYTEITPGPRNIPAVEKLARTLHPDLTQ